MSLTPAMQAVNFSPTTAIRGQNTIIIAAKSALSRPQPVSKLSGSFADREPNEAAQVGVGPSCYAPDVGESSSVILDKVSSCARFGCISAPSHYRFFGGSGSFHFSSASLWLLETQGLAGSEDETLFFLDTSPRSKAAHRSARVSPAADRSSALQDDDRRDLQLGAASRADRP